MVTTQCNYLIKEKKRKGKRKEEEKERKKRKINILERFPLQTMHNQIRCASSFQ